MFKGSEPIKLSKSQIALLKRLQKGDITELKMRCRALTRVKYHTRTFFWQNKRKTQTVKFNTAFALYSRELIDIASGLDGEGSQRYSLIVKDLKINKKGEATWNKKH